VAAALRITTAASASRIPIDILRLLLGWGSLSRLRAHGDGLRRNAGRCPPQSLHVCAADPHTQTPAASDHSITPHRAAGCASRPSLSESRHASHRLGECEACAAEREHCDGELYPSAPEHRALAPINGVSANSGARVLPAVPLRARLAQWRAQRWLARAAPAIRGFPDGASGSPDALCIRGRRAELIGTFDACNPSLRHTTTTCRRRSLSMDGDAPSVMGSPEREDYYTLVIG
jgi:hypothetical protein